MADASIHGGNFGQNHCQLSVFLYFYRSVVTLLTSTLIDSMTSIKISFFLYLMPSDLQETALVTVVGTLVLVTSSLLPSCVMYLQMPIFKTTRFYFLMGNEGLG